MSSRRFGRWVSLTAGAVLVLTTTVPAIGAGDDFGLSSAEDGWSLAGAELAPTGDGFLVLEPADGVREEVSAGTEDERFYLTSSDGALVGLLQSPDLDSPAPSLSFLVDHASSQLELAWPDVEGASSYEIYHNFEPVDTVEAPGYKISLRSVAPDDVISVHAMAASPTSRTDPTSNLLGIGSLIVAPEYLDGSPAAAGESEVGDPVVGPSPRVGTVSSGAEIMAAAPSYTGIVLRSFIPNAYVGSNILCGSGFGSNEYFGGDNRGFTTASTSKFRTNTEVLIRWTGTDSIKKQVNPTKRYRKNSNGTYTLIDSKNASTSKITVSTGWHGTSKTVKAVNARVSVANPYCLKVLTLTIDQTVSGLVTRKAGYTGLNLTITHDKAPSHEFHFFSSDTSTRVMHRWTNSGFHCLNGLVCTQNQVKIVR